MPRNTNEYVLLGSGNMRYGGYKYHLLRDDEKVVHVTRQRLDDLIDEHRVIDEGTLPLDLVFKQEGSTNELRRFRGRARCR